MWRIGRRLYCRARNEVSVNDIRLNGESYVQACVLKSADAPLLVLDVGANLGEWTRQLLNQLPSDRIAATRVFAFEPIETTRAKLSRNVSEMMHGQVVTIVPAAVSDMSGEAEMVVLTATGGTNSLEFDGHVADRAIARKTVTTTTLDTFCDELALEHVHLLKCDAEGHDARVLAGARELLLGGRVDVVQFEYNHRWVYARAYLKDVFDLVDELPYRVGRVCSTHIELFKSWHFELERYFESNYVLLHEDAVGWFDAREGSFDETNTWAPDGVV